MTTMTFVPYDQTKPVERDGKYVVRTVSTKYETVNYLTAKVTRVKSGAGYENRVNVNNQTVTHISVKPVM